MQRMKKMNNVKSFELAECYSRAALGKGLDVHNLLSKLPGLPWAKFKG